MHDRVFDGIPALVRCNAEQVFLNHALESDEVFCLVMCDIDNFKKVNDTYGHDFGDIVLKTKVTSKRKPKLQIELKI